MGDGRDIYPFKVAVIIISPEDYIITKSSMTNISASLIFTGGGGGTDVTDFFVNFAV